MLTRITSSFRTDQFSHFVYGFLYCAWDTLELGWDVLEEIGAKLVEFFIAIFNLIFQVLIFLRDLCIETMQTFANVFQGMINVISSISCEDVEDFASACIVVLLWVGVVKIIINMLSKMMSGLFSVRPPSPICARIPSIFLQPPRYQLPCHSDHQPLHMRSRDMSENINTAD
ncbi:uncharacterized protein LOC105686086 isoform X2 [Athalia rosae]|uniref:uncharacterized protein LOC105686086 isoform X2 n=1 Tax=Athalia rosae TaxID=37344 RepID=UPI00203457C4|nr:uncharacterized protein LOC105686086 isoform X2 [Athalia rosae]